MLPLKKIQILSMLLIVCSVLVAGCTSEGDDWSSNKTYSGMGVSFDYPGTWTDQSNDPMLVDTFGESGVAFGKDNEIFGFVVVDVGVLSAADKDKLINDLIETYKTELRLTNEKDIMVDGVSAKLLSSPNPTDGIYTNVAFWIKNEDLYITVYTSEKSGIETFERILNTFKTT